MDELVKKEPEELVMLEQSKEVKTGEVQTIVDRTEPEELVTSEQNEEERTDEVQTIIDRMPTTGATYVALITAILITVTICMGFLVKYPDTVDGEISITALYAPVRLIANNGGRLHLLKQNNDSVYAGEVISWFDNAAHYKDVEALFDQMIRYSEERCADTAFTENNELGELSSNYNNFILAHKQYIRFISANSYRIQRNDLNSQIRVDSSILQNIDEEISLRNQIMNLAETQHARDKKMFADRAITEADLMKRNAEYLSKREAYQSLLTNRSSLLSRIYSNKIKIDQLNTEETENKNKLQSQLLANKSELINNIEIWKQRYVTYAPIDGKVEFLGFWRENTFVQSGENLYSVLPNKNEIIGEVAIPSFGAGKVKIGQEVNVKLNNFPYDEYGSINGAVKSISQLTKKMKTNNGEIDTYLVTVSFPNGTLTNYGEKLNLNFETKGTAEIITKKKQLIHRLFDNLKYKVTP